MAKKEYSTTPLRGVFNTLAQTGTSLSEKPAIILSGGGSDVTNTKALKGKAKRKFITQTMILRLVDVAGKYGTPEQKKAYWNTYHCQNKIYTANGRLYGKYCKNKFCTLCCSIRKAKIINNYLPVIEKWEEPYFITLTCKAVPHNRLKDVMQSMVKEFQEITGKYRKRCQRGNGEKLIGIRSLESNFNPGKQTYNPHFHVITANAQMGGKPTQIDPLSPNETDPRSPF